MSEPQRSEKSLFLDALELRTTAERAAFLDQACADKPQLRADVEALLKAQSIEGGWLDAASLATPPDDSAALMSNVGSSVTEAVGTVIGPYKLLEQIGEGGMGTVFMAEQTEPVQRQVAVKIIKLGMDSRQVIARFKAEQQTLALMDHPHIARVLDAGTTVSGRPYFVMELVRGVPITTYCDEHRLSPEARLELFLGVCQAVQHSHQKGIIHRDIKPSNVLVAVYDGKAVPKVIDFGVARATGPRLDGRTLFTEFGSVVGTLEYMSPEQAESNPMDIDTRSDIYSLGVLLYELLTGTTPLDRRHLQKAALVEVLRSIREDEPPKPSTRLSATDELPSIAANRGLEAARLSGLVRGDLDWIVMKSLEKDRNRRYETAIGLGLDIRRYLRHEAVEACPPSAWYRFRKFARRNRGALISATLASTALVTAVVVLVISMMMTTRSYEAERDAHRHAEANFERARMAVDEQLTLVSQSTLFDVPGLQPVRRDLLQAALRFYQEMAKERPAGASALTDLALACLRLSEVNFELSNMDDAVVSLIAGLDFATELQRRYPNDHVSQRKLAGYWTGNRRTVGSSGPPRDLNLAHATLIRGIDLWEAFVRENPEAAGFRSDLANMYNKLGLLQITRGVGDEGVLFTRNAVDIWKDLHRLDPSAPLYRAALVAAYMQLRHCLMNTGNQQEGDELIPKAILLSEGLVAEFPDIPQYRQDLADGLYHSGERCQNPDCILDAEAAFRRAVDLAQDLLTRFPVTPAAFTVLMRSSNSLIWIAQHQIRSEDKVAALYEELIPLMEKIAADNRNRSDELSRATAAMSYLELTHLYKGRGRYEAAENACRESVTLYERLVADSPTQREYHVNRDNAARFLVNLSKFRERKGTPATPER